MPFISSATCTPSARNARIIEASVMLLPLSKRQTWALCTPIFSPKHISLFPVNTYKNRENGMRRDLAQALEDLHPGIFRFPGGCIVEGTDLATRYQWKNSVGPVENRPLNQNRWEHTFDHRYFPDYYQSYGLGFFEFFQLSEDIGAEPLPIISVGLACQFQNWNKESAHVKTDELQPYIDDCLDLIEFANGPADSKWGKVFAGEYACHGKGKKWNHYEAAIMEAALMTGFERNADIVHMTSPAPLFAHVDGWQWRPDQIWYDQTQMFKTVSYYVQQLYATNKGTHVLQLTMDKRPVANQEGQNGLFASAAFDKDAGEVIVKVANTSKHGYGRREQHPASRTDYPTVRHHCR